MPLPRVRFTMRRLMALVAVAALLIWMVVVAMRWTDYRGRVEHHEEIALLLTGEIIALRGQGGFEGEVAMREMAMADEIKQAARYRRAIRRLWLPIGSGPE